MANKKIGKLQYFRKKIDKIDGEILKLLIKRFDIVQKIMEYKKLKGIQIVDKKRENQILSKLKPALRKYKPNAKYIENIFKSIIKNSKEISGLKQNRNYCLF
jgi:monofunctional chorismate mutase